MCTKFGREAVKPCGEYQGREETLTSCGFAAKTLKHKNYLASYASLEIFSLQNFSFLHPQRACE